MSQNVLDLNSTKVKVVIFNIPHYQMEDNKGISAVVLGNYVDDNNRFGIDVSEAKIPNFNELNYLKTIPSNDFPGLFEADQGMSTVKKNGKSVTGVSLSNLKYIAKVNMTVDAK